MLSSRHNGQGRPGRAADVRRRGGGGSMGGGGERGGQYAEEEGGSNSPFSYFDYSANW